ncbi:MAG: hypothetical protein MRY83_09610 [Flavobacteriales bacterium]|nr:hypothetical protein [Flavobacteriales bacterium]
MIIYEPNKHFLGDIKNLMKSWTMVKILRGTLIMGVFAFVVCFPLDYFELTEKLKIDLGVFSFLGVVLSILLVFRTNTAYDRWWEGRKQWGALVNNCRNMAIMANVTFPKEDQANRHQLAVLISNFCISFKEHLRKGTKLEELIFVSESELEIYKTKTHVPNHISNQIHDLVQQQYKKGYITGEDILNFKPQLQSLLDILGACERIKKTPIPFSYATYIKIFILAYALLIPFALAPILGMWASVPIVMIIFFAFIGLELMAEEIQDPFGLDCNNLPTGTIAHTIKNNVFEILEPEKKVTKIEHKVYEKIF